MNWHETKFQRRDDGTIDCSECKHQSWDGYEEEYPICTLDNHELYPLECEDFETYKFKYVTELDKGW